MQPDFFHLNLYLWNNLPQEWLVVDSELTTCRGPITFIRVEDPNAIPEKKLVCLIHLSENAIIVFSPSILSPTASKVVKTIKKAIDDGVISSRCLTLTECPTTCETCHEAINFYEENLISP